MLEIAKTKRPSVTFVVSVTRYNFMLFVSVSMRQSSFSTDIPAHKFSLTIGSPRAANYLAIATC